MNVMTTPPRTFWNVAFYYRSFTITDTVAAISADDAIVLAENRIHDFIDIDVSGCDVDTDNTQVPAESDDE